MTFRQSKQHGLLGGFAPVLTLLAVGCSLIVPLDEYVGNGTPEGGKSAGGSGGTGGSDSVGGTEGTLGGAGGSVGGTVAVGGTGVGATGGTEPSVGGTGETGGSEGGTDNSGGAPEAGGVAGEPQGGEGAEPPLGGTAGLGTGATAGIGAMSGSAGNGGRGGMGGMGGMGCGNPDFATDHENCGSCGHACDADAECLAGYCASSPCDGVCATFATVHLAKGMGYKANNIGTAEVCTEIYGYAPASGNKALVCWNFDNGRTLAVNGTNNKCDGAGHAFNVPLRMNGLCVRATAGNWDTAGFELTN